MVVCRFILICIIVCLCGVITTSYFSLFISQLCNIIVCLFPKVSSDIRFRMTDAILGLVIFNVLNCFFLQFFVVSLTWIMYFRVGEKSIYRFLRMIITFSWLV